MKTLFWISFIAIILIAFSGSLLLGVLVFMVGIPLMEVCIDDIKCKDAEESLLARSHTNQIK